MFVFEAHGSKAVDQMQMQIDVGAIQFQAAFQIAEFQDGGACMPVSVIVFEWIFLLIRIVVAERIVVGTGSIRSAILSGLGFFGFQISQMAVDQGEEQGVILPGRRLFQSPGAAQPVFLGGQGTILGHFFVQGDRMPFSPGRQRAELSDEARNAGGVMGKQRFRQGPGQRRGQMGLGVGQQPQQMG
ncbi:MAG: hypothetical protein HQL82_15840, partial [Magnetococcales bacterium]|nr:hypothetical protein [Magnetococcales bacterium]